MSGMPDTLIYVHDPMCSWCYGFEATRRVIFNALDGRMPVRRLLGGLAPDSDQPMPESTRSMVRQAWRQIEQVIPGVSFNYDFWDQNEPRRSTYPASRAVIAARAQGEGFDLRMTARIQQGYYREARNPSNNELLIELAEEIGLDRERFSIALTAASTHERLLAEIGTSRAMGIDSFPSLALQNRHGIRHVGLNYNDPQAMLAEIEAG